MDSKRQAHQGDQDEMKRHGVVRYGHRSWKGTKTQSEKEQECGQVKK